MAGGGEAGCSVLTAVSVGTGSVANAWILPRV